MVSGLTFILPPSVLECPLERLTKNMVLGWAELDSWQKEMKNYSGCDPPRHKPIYEGFPQKKH